MLLKTEREHPSLSYLSSSSSIPLKTPETFGSNESGYWVVRPVGTNTAEVFFRRRPDTKSVAETIALGPDESHRLFRKNGIGLYLVGE